MANGIEVSTRIGADKAAAPKGASRDASDYYSLHVSLLRKCGLLLIDTHAQISFWWEVDGKAERGGAVWDPKQRILRVTETLYGRGHEIVVVHNDRPRGQRVCFICPITGKLCLALFLVGDKLASRQGLKLLYPSQLDTPWERQDRIRCGGPARLEYVPLEPRLTAEALSQLERLRQSRRPRDNEFGTLAGLAALIPFEFLEAAKKRVVDLLEQAPSNSAPPPSHLTTPQRASAHPDRGTDSDGSDRHASVKVISDQQPADQQPADQNLSGPCGSEPGASGVPMAQTFAENLPISLVEFQPRLEILALAREGLVEAGAQRFACAGWEAHRGGTITVSFCVDLTNSDQSKLAVLTFFKGVSFGQVFAITPPEPGPRQRRHFVCPNTGKRVEVLFFREGLWASRHALALKHASQRSKRFTKHVRQGRRDG